jgi:hypothetical protein
LPDNHSKAEHSGAKQSGAKPSGAQRSESKLSVAQQTNMIKFPLRIDKELDLTSEILGDLLVYYAKQLVKKYGDFVSSDIKFGGEILLKLHEGKIGSGSKASLDFHVDPRFTYRGVREE